MNATPNSLARCRWGYPFLYESYLYHLHRLDHRHNFSPYFYLTYLTYPSSDLASADTTPLTLWSNLLRSPLTSFLPQMGLAVGLGLVFGREKRDLVFAWFVQTVVFVVFNKVCTSQVSSILFRSQILSHIASHTVLPLVPPPAAPTATSAVDVRSKGSDVYSDLGRDTRTMA